VPFISTNNAELGMGKAKKPSGRPFSNFRAILENWATTKEIQH